MMAPETSISRAATGVYDAHYKRHREMTPEERRQMISEAAHYRVLRRGFHGGADVEEWLEAEAETGKLLRHG